MDCLETLTLAVMTLTVMLSDRVSVGSARDIRCYSCSSYISQCRDVINHRSEVHRGSCSTKCFIRQGEDSAVYRGCFDEFTRVTQLTSDYVGCRNQTWNNRHLVWCFCGTDLCNGVSISELEGGSTNNTTIGTSQLSPPSYTVATTLPPSASTPASPGRRRQEVSVPRVRLDSGRGVFKYIEEHSASLGNDVSAVDQTAARNYDIGRRNDVGKDQSENHRKLYEERTTNHQEGKSEGEMSEKPLSMLNKHQQPQSEEHHPQPLRQKLNQQLQQQWQWDFHHHQQQYQHHEQQLQRRQQQQLQQQQLQQQQLQQQQQQQREHLQQQRQQQQQQQQQQEQQQQQQEQQQEQQQSNNQHRQPQQQLADKSQVIKLHPKQHQRHDTFKSLMSDAGPQEEASSASQTAVLGAVGGTRSNVMTNTKTQRDEPGILTTSGGNIAAQWESADRSLRDVIRHDQTDVFVRLPGRQQGGKLGEGQRGQVGGLKARESSSMTGVPVYGKLTMNAGTTANQQAQQTHANANNNGKVKVNALKADGRNIVNGNGRSNGNINSNATGQKNTLQIRPLLTAVRTNDTRSRNLTDSNMSTINDGIHKRRYISDDDNAKRFFQAVGKYHRESRSSIESENSLSPETGRDRRLWEEPKTSNDNGDWLNVIRERETKDTSNYYQAPQPLLMTDVDEELAEEGDEDDDEWIANDDDNEGGRRDGREGGLVMTVDRAHAKSAAAGEEEDEDQLLIEHRRRFGRVPPHLSYVSPELAAQIECDGSGYYDHPTDCTQYIACVYDPYARVAVMHLMRCPELLYWENARKICVEHSSGCGRPAHSSSSTPSSLPSSTSAPTTTSPVARNDSVIDLVQLREKSSSSTDPQ